jgi:hypothetical protein
MNELLFAAWILFKEFGQGFIVGVFLRVVVAVLSKTDATYKGIFFSGCAVGLLKLGIFLYAVYKN